MKNNQTFEMSDILAILPHRSPFLFVDRVTRFVPEKEIIAERLIKVDEPFFAGHFPGKAIMPGVLITDALAQTSGLLWGFSKKASTGFTEKTPQIFFLAAASMKYVNPSYPGETLQLISNYKNNFGALYTYEVEALVKRKLVAKGTLTLAMVDGVL